jgi:hypothetical protein
MIADKQKQLVGSIRSRKITCSWHSSSTSILEGVFARGDRRLVKVIFDAWKSGCRLDSWDEFFKFDRWKKVFVDNGLSMEFYASRRRPYDEILPWDHLDFGVNKAFLKAEAEHAYEGVTTPNCRESCSGCGANRLMEGGRCSVR